MTPYPSAPTATHMLQTFDSQLENLHALTLDLLHLTLSRLESALKALSSKNCELALNIIASSPQIYQLARTMDSEILNVLARQQPLAGDLRMVIAMTRITAELEKINSEICDIAHLILTVFEPRPGGFNHEVPLKIATMGQALETMLKKLLTAFWKRRTQPAYALLANSTDYETQLQTCIQEQLGIAAKNTRLVGKTLNILAIIKAFDHCSEYCCHMAECIIFMVEGTYTPSCLPTSKH